tara:strand:+ start:39 stop:347 length:309 start_codon:yes stop_codon:yes gene_type:complete
MTKFPRSLRDIAIETDNIFRDNKVKCPYAKPYLEAMACLDTPDDNFGADSGRSVVLYFLTNASTWRGPDARRIKAELKNILRDDQHRRDVAQVVTNYKGQFD